jgi:hypothetical protein
MTPAVRARPVPLIPMPPNNVSYLEVTRFSNNAQFWSGAIKGLARARARVETLSWPRVCARDTTQQ